MSFGRFQHTDKPMQPLSEINTTPLVDVMLVLLVIFIITAPLISNTVRLQLPVADAESSAVAPQTLRLALDAQGQLYWNDELIQDEDLKRRLAEAAGLTPQPEVHLRADRDTRYQRLAELMAEVQRAGIERMGFVTEPR